MRILEHAIEPLAPQLTPAMRTRLHKALSVVYGIEPYVILKDIWGLGDREVERIAMWIADALIDAALAQSRKPQSALARRAGSDNGHGTRRGGTPRVAVPK